MRFFEHGRSGIRRATLVVSWYRVALVSGGRVRWIPLEEVNGVARADRLTVAVDAWGEHLRFVPAKRSSARRLVGIVRQEVAAARVPNSPRHHPDLLQEWCERSSRRWNSSFYRARVRLSSSRARASASR